VSDFDELMSDLDPPMFVVTVAAQGAVGGCLVGFAGQTSIDPPRFAVWISRENRTAEIAAHATHFVVHCLRDDDHDNRVAAVFGELSGDDVDKFALVDWTPTVDGTPALIGCDRFVGRVLEAIDTDGDHRGYVLEPEEVARARGPFSQLGLQAAKDLDPGHPV
jgi:flavin reductase (DIM6/NTAB) family NADH-FMN oxidoreductase RutF